MSGWSGGAEPGSALAAGRVPPCAAAAGAVLLSTCVMAALEPCLPLWIMQRFHPQVNLTSSRSERRHDREMDRRVTYALQKWVSGVVFVPDSAAYALSASVLGGAGGAGGARAPEPLALAGQLCVGLAALALPHAASVGARHVTSRREARRG